MTNKVLVYYTIGGAPEYCNLLRFSIFSLYSNDENKESVDIMVMCDVNYSQVLAKENLPIKYIHITRNNDSPVHASMRKTEIFDFKQVYDYQSVLYLDCDITVNGPIASIMEKVQCDNVVYVVPEGKNVEDHKKFWYCPADKEIPEAQLQIYQSNGIQTFNAGQFAFRPSEQVKRLFTLIVRAKRDYDPRIHFYEQCFMNYYWNPLDCLDYSIKNNVQFVLDYERDPINTINHFTNASIPFNIKLGMMISHLQRHRTIQQQ